MSDKNNKFEEIKGEDWELVESDSPEIENEAGIENDSEQLAETEEVSQDEETTSKKGTRRFVSWIVVIVIIGVVALSTILLIGSSKNGDEKVAVNVETEGDDHNEGESREVKLEPESLNSANIEIEGVTSRPAVALLKTNGTIESNPQQTQQVTSLVSGRVEKVFVSIGDRVSANQTVAILMSTEIAAAYGKWKEAQTRVELSQKNLARIKKTENRVNILQAKARLDEADATLKRVKRLIELEAGAGKDLISAQTNYKTAKAEYDFQRNIPLNKEIQEAEAEVKTAQVDANHLKQSLQTLGVNVSSTSADVRSVASVPLRSPLAGQVTERLVTTGSGVQAGQPLMTLSNISSVWVTASVPENQLGLIRIGTVAEVTSPVLGETVLNARVTYIDPQINEDTRTGRVRLAVNNPGEKLRAGMFAEIGFQTGTNSATGEELVVPTEAIQRIGDETVVFIPKENEAGAFEVREVKIGGEVENYTRVISGLEINDKVVTKGSFTLKTALQKGELGEHGH